ncbi:enoyl-CoA hydratase/isomerase family protein [Xanthobacter sp. KR7-65]|uniref:enoyl-CoA hydratase/isomerase family protein n=1 Tax=Xanthobacter sp. KR7-65 TaxID=3156612 RepID=UPI0032B52396
MTDTAQVLAEEAYGTVRRLTLLRPLRRNAMDGALVETLAAALRRLDRDESVRAIVLDGVAPGFCAGSDLKYISAMELDAMCRFEQACGDLGRLMAFLSKPVVAAVEGFAIGGGLTLAACCDLVVAGKSSRWSLPEVPIGWLTPWGLKALVARVGFVRARTLCFCLDALTGEEAVAMGLADRMAPDGEALASALRLAGQIAELPPPAVAATKRFFARHVMADGEAMDVEANLLFAANCAAPAARATFATFRAKSV